MRTCRGRREGDAFKVGGCQYDPGCGLGDIVAVGTAFPIWAWRSAEASFGPSAHTPTGFTGLSPPRHSTPRSILIQPVSKTTCEPGHARRWLSRPLGILRIRVGLREGLDIEGRVFDVSRAGRTARAWMKRRVEASQPVLSGMFNRAEVTYAWSVRTGPSAPTSSGDREPEQDLGVFGWIGAEGSEARFACVRPAAPHFCAANSL